MGRIEFGAKIVGPVRTFPAAEGRTVRVETLADGSGYLVDGEFFVRQSAVSGILSKPGLEAWAVRMALGVIRQELGHKMGIAVRITDRLLYDLVTMAEAAPDRARDDAGVTGTRLDKALRAFVDGRPIAGMDECAEHVGAFEEWTRREGIFWFAGDHFVVSRELGVAGELDAVGRRGRGIVIADFKSSPRFYPEQAGQVGFYALGWEETFGDKVEEGWILRFKKPGSARRGPVMEPKRVRLDSALEFFTCLKGAYDGRSKDLFF